MATISTPPEAAAAPPRQTFQVGDKVEGVKDEGNIWESAVVTAFNVADNSYSLVFEGGETVTDAMEDIDVRPLTEFKVGESIDANWKGQGAWFPGEIVSYNAVSKTYSISYSDGSKEANVLAANVRAVPKVQQAPKIGKTTGGAVTPDAVGQPSGPYGGVLMTPPCLFILALILAGLIFSSGIIFTVISYQYNFYVKTSNCPMGAKLPAPAQLHYFGVLDTTRELPNYWNATWKGTQEWGMCNSKINRKYYAVSSKGRVSTTLSFADSHCLLWKEETLWNGFDALGKAAGKSTNFADAGMKVREGVSCITAGIYLGWFGSFAYFISLSPNIVHPSHDSSVHKVIFAFEFAFIFTLLAMAADAYNRFFYTDFNDQAKWAAVFPGCTVETYVDTTTQGLLAFSIAILGLYLLYLFVVEALTCICPVWMDAHFFHEHSNSAPDAAPTEADEDKDKDLATDISDVDVALAAAAAASGAAGSEAAAAVEAPEPASSMRKSRHFQRVQAVGALVTGIKRVLTRKPAEAAEAQAGAEAGASAKDVEMGSVSNSNAYQAIVNQQNEDGGNVPVYRG